MSDYYNLEEMECPITCSYCGHMYMSRWDCRRYDWYQEIHSHIELCDQCEEKLNQGTITKTHIIVKFISIRHIYKQLTLKNQFSLKNV